MPKCKVCKSEVPESVATCHTCGYDFNSDCISDAWRLRGYIRKLKVSKDWISEVELKRKVHEIQIRAKWPRRFRVSEDEWEELGGNWTLRSAAKLFKEQVSLIHADLDLAKGLLKYPDFAWRDIPNKKQAIEAKEEFDLLGVPPFFTAEQSLQEFIELKWEDLRIFREWSLKASAVKIPRGEIDLLAHHREKERWLVIELKKGLADEKTVGQVLRYIGSARKEIIKDHEDVEGLIIAAGAREGFQGTIPISPKIDFAAYFVDKGDLKFLPSPLAFHSVFLRLIRQHGYDGAIAQLERLDAEGFLQD
jgi:hypothetical protein